MTKCLLDLDYKRNKKLELLKEFFGKSKVVKSVRHFGSQKVKCVNCSKVNKLYDFVCVDCGWLLYATKVNVLFFCVDFVWWKLSEGKFEKVKK